MNSEHGSKPVRYRDSRLVRWGVGLLVIGSGPLFLIIAAAGMGLTKDPNPNPVGFGILAGVTIWPAVVMIIVGIVSVSRAKARSF
jgi:hypothetical protein